MGSAPVRRQPPQDQRRGARDCMPVATRVRYRRVHGGREARSETREAPVRRVAKRRGGCCCHAGRGALPRPPAVDQSSVRLLRTKESAPGRGTEAGRLKVLCPTWHECKIGSTRNSVKRVASTVFARQPGGPVGFLKDRPAAAWRQPGSSTGAKRDSGML